MPDVLSEVQRAFLATHHDAVMTTVDAHGHPHAVPVLVGMVGDELWSSGTEDRVRTAHVEVPGAWASFTVLSPGFWGKWLTVAGPVTIRREDRVADNLRLYRVVTGGYPDDLDEYEAAMKKDRRLIFALTPKRVYPSMAG